jgi:hypothetical protein
MLYHNYILKISYTTIFLFSLNIVSAQYYFDSTYIKKYYNNALWSLYQNYNNHSLYISQKFQRDSTTNTALNPIAESLTNVGFSYSDEKRFIAINLYSVPYQPSKRKPQPRAINFVIGINADNKVSELGLNWFTGYYEKNSANFLNNFNDSTAYYNYDKLKTINVYYNFINFTNKRKFSYAAAYKGSALQKKSSSSFVYYLSANYNGMNSDNAFIPNQIRNSYDKFGQMNRLSNAYILAGIGYSGTLVIRKAFFSNLTIMGGPGLQYQNYALVNERKTRNSINLLLQGDIRYSIGLNFKHFYLISSTFISLKSYNMSKMAISSGHLMNQFTIGLRLNRKGRIF